MSKEESKGDVRPLTREKLAALLNEDLAREFQAIIAYVVYSQVLKGAEYMSIADQLQTHAKGVEARTHHFSPNRLFGRDANRSG